MPRSKKDYSLVMPLLVKTMADSVNWKIQDFLAVPGPTTINFLNAHGVNQAAKTADFARFILNSTYLLRDGVGLKLAYKLLKMKDTPNLNGTDLIPTLLAPYKDRRIAIFGTSDGALAACAARLRDEGFVAIGCLRHGFHGEEEYLAAVAEFDPAIVVICMGMPRQELLAARLAASTNTRLIICGGGWADFYSGTKHRAPAWIRRLSLEWVYRLLNEPKRLGKRYTIDLLTFFYTVYRSRLV